LEKKGDANLLFEGVSGYLKDLEGRTFTLERDSVNLSKIKIRANLKLI
jgi:hypothetical protein